MTHEIDTRLRALERAVRELAFDAEKHDVVAAIPDPDAAPEPTPAAPATRWWVCDNAGEAFMASLVVTLPTGEAKRLGELAAEGGLIQPLHGRLLLGSGEARRG
jgi:hypothetical protein